MNVLETEWWSLAIPPQWWAESVEDSILVGDQDDVGCIEISTLHKDEGEFELQALRVIALSESEQALSWQSVALGEFSGVYSRYVDEGVAIRQWYVARGPMLLFITYSCDEENAELDDAAVDELLDTLMALDSVGDS